MLSDAAVKKLERIAELMIQRERIEGELERLLDSSGFKPLSIRNKVPEKTVKVTVHRKPSACSACGEVGHQARKCTSTSPVNPLSKSTGTAHAALSHMSEVEVEIYNTIKLLNDEQETKEYIAAHENVTLAQVSAVLESKNWDTYHAKFPH